MIAKILKILKGIKNIDSRVHKIEESTSQIRNEKKSDIERWQDKNELFIDWNERTAILGDFIALDSDIIEFGAGNMFLKKYLSNYRSYTPSDIVKRFDETVVCDLNGTIDIDFSKYQAVVFSGVLEYVYDIDRVFEIISKDIKQVVVSYCCSDIVTLTREKNGWLSDYTYNELIEIFKKYNFEIINYAEWRKQSIFNLIKKSNTSGSQN